MEEKLNNKPVIFRPLISGMQKMALYETKARIFLVGSNNTQTKFRILKIDRTEPRALVVIDDHIEYSHQEIRDLLSMIDMGNRPRQKNNLGFTKTVSAFGIVGFVKFLEGYYMILITKRRRVANIGYHTIYKVEDTSMVYIPNETVRVTHPDEARYVKLFQSVDLSSNFYFSYSYDISRTLQFNMTLPQELRHTSSVKLCDPVRNGNHAVGTRSFPNMKFVWNSYLLKPVESILHPDWVLPITHGFVGQSNISIFSKPLYLTLIARRSNRYAGTRFLKRGANLQGDVANEVETEQIVHDASVSDFQTGRFTSFVQMRGSVPLQWSQDVSKMVPKPTIAVDLSDPFAETSAQHFGQLLKRYGSPVILLNLVKKREKKRHESLLTGEFLSAVTYLNQFLPPQHHVQYIGFDMARLNKLKEVDVMVRLADISSIVIKRTGIFCSFEPSHKDPEMEENYSKGRKASEESGLSDDHLRRQMGIVRVNCVDCLDRTNTAQFALGRCALAFQLHALGVVAEPHLEFDSDCVRMLEELYEDHGDTLALQYGGSQLVHRIKTYRKVAPWTSQGTDIMQTLSRYYSNTFSDADKQNAINLFLGAFIPQETRLPIWELTSDHHLHRRSCIKSSYTQWWSEKLLKFLPLPLEEVLKTCSMIVPCSYEDVLVDGYYEYYRPFEFSILSDLFAYTVSHSVRDFMPNFTTDFSPFSVRVRPGKRREELSSKKALALKNPSLTGHSSTGSTNSSNSTDSETSGDDEEKENSVKPKSEKDRGVKETDSRKNGTTFSQIFPTMKKVYGVEVHVPHRNDITIYKRYSNIAASCFADKPVAKKPVKVIQQSAFSIDCSMQVNTPVVGKASLSIYMNYIQRGLGTTKPTSKDLHSYQNYVSQL